MLSTKKLLGFSSAAQGKRKCLKRKQTQQPKKQSQKKLRRVRVHLGNLAENTQTSDVGAFFPMATLVDLKFEEESNICKGFGFLEFKTQKVAEKALKKNGQILNGNVVALKLVGEENVELPFQQGHVIGVLGFQVNDTLPQIRQRLEAHFEKCGPIKQLFLPPNLNLQNYEGTAYIEFEDYEGFKKAFHQKYALPLPGDSAFLKIIRPKFEEMPFLRGMGGGRGGKWGYEDANGFIEDDLPQDPTRHMGTGQKTIFNV